MLDYDFEVRNTTLAARLLRDITWYVNELSGLKPKVAPWKHRKRRQKLCIRTPTISGMSRTISFTRVNVD
jgi:hypothetical protein